MALVDAYINFGDEIPGGYKPSANITAATDHAGHEFTHEDWSEITSFDYSISGVDNKQYPEFKIKKVLDCASNTLFLRLLQHDSRANQKAKNATESRLPKIIVHLCRWVEGDEVGKRKCIVFLQYVFTKCHVLSYSTGLDFGAEEIPEENITFGYSKMEMAFWPDETLNAVGFTWDSTQAAPEAFDHRKHHRNKP